jgi:hypothetical protein
MREDRTVVMERRMKLVMAILSALVYLIFVAWTGHAASERAPYLPSLAWQIEHINVSSGQST